MFLAQEAPHLCAEILESAFDLRGRLWKYQSLSTWNNGSFHHSVSSYDEQGGIGIRD